MTVKRVLRWSSFLTFKRLVKWDVGQTSMNINLMSERFHVNLVAVVVAVTWLYYMTIYILPYDSSMCVVFKNYCEKVLLAVPKSGNLNLFFFECSASMYAVFNEN